MYLRHRQRLFIHAPIASKCQHPLTVPVPVAPEHILHLLSIGSATVSSNAGTGYPTCLSIVMRCCTKMLAARSRVGGTTDTSVTADPLPTSSLLVRRLRSSRSAKLSNMSTTVFGPARRSGPDSHSGPEITVLGLQHRRWIWRKTFNVENDSTPHDLRTVKGRRAVWTGSCRSCIRWN